MANLTEIARDVQALLQGSLRELQADLQVDLADLATYTAQRTAHLSTIVGLPGFEEAVIAERDAIALRAGINAVNAADKVDARLIGLLHGVLFLGARLVVI